VVVQEKVVQFGSEFAPPPWGDGWVQVCRFIADIPVLPRLEFGTDSRY